MKKLKNIIPALVIIASTTAFQSCSNDDEKYYVLSYPTALVTVCPDENESFVMQLDNETTLFPTNMTKSPFGAKEVRALVNYTTDDTYPDGTGVFVNWIDSIRTKTPVMTLGENDIQFGNDPIDIIKDWVTIAEDGYLTLRFRTVWGYSLTPHQINLITGINPDDPFEFELRHNAYGDLNGRYADGIIAFNLNELPHIDDNTKIKLHWNSFMGKKTVEFDLQFRRNDNLEEDEIKNLKPARLIK